MSIYFPPHVVNDAYVRSFGLSDPSRLYRLMAPGVWVIERRLSDDEMVQVGLFDVTKLDTYGRVQPIKVQSLYKPVYVSKLIDVKDQIVDFSDERASEGIAPHSWWLDLSQVAPSERIRFPALAAKMSMKECFDLGELRELYRWDGTGFRLRDEAWGRE